MDKANIGVIGLGAMGSNLALNLSRNFNVSVYNRTYEKTRELIKDYGKDKLVGYEHLPEFINSLSLPRKVIIMVPAGAATDQVIDEIKLLLTVGDIIIDCGNSYYKDTNARMLRLKNDGLNFVGCGVSGGEEGALHGPSLMPGCDLQIYNQLENIFKTIAAKDFSSNACVTYIGENGAGHFVKMVHNGIEYSVMELISEIYDIYRSLYMLDSMQIAQIFEEYNLGKLNSYLIEITSKVLKQKDEKTDDYLINKILDRAGQKGTGKWTSIDSLDRDVALPSITEAVFARVISSDKETRLRLSKIYNKSLPQNLPSLDQFKEQAQKALYCAQLSSYAQGYDLIQKAAISENWHINLSEISRIWEGGCIIRSQLLNLLHQAFAGIDINMHLFEINIIVEEMESSKTYLRDVVSLANLNGVAVPSLSTALSYFEMMTSQNLPANLIQGLRDYFGAHTYERNDMGGSFHTNWNQ